MNLLFAAGIVLDQPPAAGPFEGAVAAEVGMLLLIGAACFLAGLLLFRKAMMLLKVTVLILVALSILVLAGAVSFQMPGLGEAGSGLMVASSCFVQAITESPLRGGVALASLAAGVYADVRARHARRSQ